MRVFDENAVYEAGGGACAVLTACGSCLNRDYADKSIPAEDMYLPEEWSKIPSGSILDCDSCGGCR